MGRELPTGPARYLFSDASTWAAQIARPLAQMSIEEVAELIRRLQIPDERIVEFVKRLHRNNINGLVLQSCDLSELRQTLGAPLGDWTLIQLLVETLRNWSPPLKISPTAGTEHALFPAGAASAIPIPAPERSQQQHNPRHQASSLHSIKEGFEPENTKGPVLIVEDGDDNCAAFTNDERVALLDREELQSKGMEEEEKDEEDDDVTSTKSVAGSSRSALKNSLSPGRDLSL